MTYPKIKPCPECGQDPFLFGYEGYNGQVSSWRVECDPCPKSPGGIYIGSCEGRKLDAIRAHNARASKVAPNGPPHPLASEGQHHGR